MENPRKKVYTFRANEEDAELIEKKFRLSECKSESEFFRLMILDGIVIKSPRQDMKKIFSLMGNISNNLNQIAAVMSRTDTPYTEEFEQMKRKVDEIWQSLRFTQSALLKSGH